MVLPCPQKQSGGIEGSQERRAAGGVRQLILNVPVHAHFLLHHNDGWGEALISQCNAYILDLVPVLIHGRNSNGHLLRRDHISGGRRDDGRSTGFRRNFTGLVGYEYVPPDHSHPAAVLHCAGSQGGKFNDVFPRLEGVLNAVIRDQDLVVAPGDTPLRRVDYPFYGNAGLDGDIGVAAG